ncbi:hypothetical protein SPHINGOR109_11235 [Sphingorhabdus sp. 109]|nr:hypothetical protein SPHINGOR109_11235 [Sphingorhabdus sp. 109]
MRGEVEKRAALPAIPDDLGSLYGAFVIRLGSTILYFPPISSNRCCDYFWRISCVPTRKPLSTGSTPPFP